MLRNKFVGDPIYTFWKKCCEYKILHPTPVLYLMITVIYSPSNWNETHPSWRFCSEEMQRDCKVQYPALKGWISSLSSVFEQLASSCKEICISHPNMQTNKTMINNFWIYIKSVTWNSIISWTNKWHSWMNWTPLEWFWACNPHLPDPCMQILSHQHPWTGRKTFN